MTSEGARVLARTPHPAPGSVAQALADAFLSTDEWMPQALVDAGAHALGGRRRWLGRVAAEVLRSFARPPRDAPLLLGTVIAATPAFTEAVRKADERGAPLRVHHHIVTASVSREPAGALPAIRDLADLAELLDLRIGHLEWLADTQHRNRRARPGPLHLHRYEWRPRPGRVPRMLEIPGPRLRRAQRALLHRVLAFIPIGDAAHGFVPGRSAVTGAARHTASAAVISFDLTTFFARVTAGRVYGALRQAGFSEAVAHTMTGLSTNAVPARVIAAMPQGGSLDERFALRRALAASHLAQGAPSSPMLANLAVRRLDSRLAGWAEASGAVYTRYADDLAFSGGEALAARSGAFMRGVQRIVEDEGYEVNPRKTRLRRRGVRQTVTGIVVNDRLNVPRDEFDRLKATIHNCVVHGPTEQNRGGVEDFREHLRGRISWVESLNPQRGARLREEFERIRW